MIDASVMRLMIEELNFDPSDDRVSELLRCREYVTAPNVPRSMESHSRTWSLHSVLITRNNHVSLFQVLSKT